MVLCIPWWLIALGVVILYLVGWIAGCNGE
jgi:hypothetical protein